MVLFSVVQATEIYYWKRKENDIIMVNNKYSATTNTKQGRTQVHTIYKNHKNDNNFTDSPIYNETPI
jgi:hypothetical protein